MTDFHLYPWESPHHDDSISFYNNEWISGRHWFESHLIYEFIDTWLNILNITPFAIPLGELFFLLSPFSRTGGLTSLPMIYLQGGLMINHHADQSLNSFCQWQSALVGKNGRRHDHAILLTGFDICSWKNEPCDTLGMVENVLWYTSKCLLPTA